MTSNIWHFVHFCIACLPSNMCLSGLSGGRAPMYIKASDVLLHIPPEKHEEARLQCLAEEKRLLAAPGPELATTASSAQAPLEDQLEQLLQQPSKIADCLQAGIFFSAPSWQLKLANMLTVGTRQLQSIADNLMERLHIDAEIPR
mmetsp:Transcript_102449/g.176907  ORF Transcript_102449/g.176907 Transcript_102449/m.176907 type:complete len:145 (-) Transcript_102449:649-1083(-)